MSTTFEEKELITKYVRLNLKSKKTVYGECFTVDPVTQTLVIFSMNQQGMFFPQIVLNHGIEEICTEPLPEVYLSSEYMNFKEKFADVLSGNTMFNKPLSKEQLDERQNQLKEWLELNRLPVTLLDDGVLSVVNGLAMIVPPYNVESCRSSNTIVLDRVMRIVKSCPNLGN